MGSDRWRWGNIWPGWGIAAGLALTAAGYWGPWVTHRAAALVLPGVDLAEYVKFLPAYRQGQLALIREGFYLPLCALSLALSALAWRPGLGWPSLLRWLAWFAALPAALAMLPPAWSPPVLRLPEFRIQGIAILVCLAAFLASPIVGRGRLGGIGYVLAGLSLLALVTPLWQFWLMVPSLVEVYGRPVTVGRGPLIMAIGLLLVAVGSIGLARQESA
jgi:hypothetical protein